MNTTTAAAALEAHVTVETIRAWARNGVIAATKVAGRWAINTASLARRIAIAAMRRTRREATVTEPAPLTTADITAVGGREWKSGANHRVYINAWHAFIGLHVETRRSGSVSYATLNGEAISNSDARKFGEAVSKVYFDTADNEIHIQWGSGTPFQMNRQELAAAISAGIRAAVAAL